MNTTTPKIAVIVEGAVTEPLIFNNLNKLFFSNATGRSTFEIVTFQFRSHIYSFFNTLKTYLDTESPFDTIALLQECIKENKSSFLDSFSVGELERLLNYKRNEFSEIFLFFDYELQHPAKKKHDMLCKLMEVFSNETENGKLYINYPMVEALQDTGLDRPCYERCLVSKDDCRDHKYKNWVKDNFTSTDIENYCEAKWQLFCKTAVRKLSCLLAEKYPSYDILNNIPIMSFQEYRRASCQRELYDGQYRDYISTSQNNPKVMVLSSIPLFLLDYFQEPFWAKMLTSPSI